METWQNHFDKKKEEIFCEILNKHLNVSNIIFRPNKKIYDFDLEIIKNGINYGYIELEQKRDWTEYNHPARYPTYSFLDRKISDPRKFVDIDPYEVFYVIHNMPMTNCVCVCIEDLCRYGITSKRNNRKNIKSRLDRYVELPIDYPGLTTGLDNTVHYILNSIDYDK